MPRSREVEFAFPQGGLVRSLAYQSQPPYTTPNALNVRPRGVFAGRHRGGSRPGLSRVFKYGAGTGALGTADARAIRLLTEMSTIEPYSPQVQWDWFEHGALGPHWLRRTWNPVDGGLPSVDSHLPFCFSEYDATAALRRQGGMYPNVEVGHVNVSGDPTVLYRVGMWILPWLGEFHGTYRLFAEMNASSPNFPQDGVMAELILGATGAWTTASKLYVNSGGAPGSGNNTAFTAGNFGVARPVWFELLIQINPAGNKASAFLDHKTVLSPTIISELSGQRTGFGIECTVDGGKCVIDGFRNLHWRDDRQAHRIVSIASAGGLVYLEQTPGTLGGTAGGSGTNVASDRLLQSVEYNGELYIADHGVIQAAGDCSINGAGVLTVADDSFYETAVAAPASMNLAVGKTTVTMPGGSDPFFDSMIGMSLRFMVSGNHYVIDSVTSELVCIVVGDCTAEAGGVRVLNITRLDTHSYAVTVYNADPNAASGSFKITAITEATPSITIDTTVATSNPSPYRIQRSPKVYSPRYTPAPSLSQWFADSGKGFVPVGCPCIALFRGRLGLAGADYAPHLFWLSRQLAPLDFDAFADPFDPARAFAGQLAEAGARGERIQAMVAHTADHLLFGTDNEVWVLRGDPGSGGELDNLGREEGVIGRAAHCRSPEGAWLFLSKSGLNILPPGSTSLPEALSRGQLPHELSAIRPEDYEVSMGYDANHRGAHIYLTPRHAVAIGPWQASTYYALSSLIKPTVPNAYFYEAIDAGTTHTGEPTWPITPGETVVDNGAIWLCRKIGGFHQHWFYHWDTGSFEPVELYEDHAPTCVAQHTRGGPSDGSVLLGSVDGFVRGYRDTFVRDEHLPFRTFVDIGPIQLGRGSRRGAVDAIDAALAQGSGSVNAIVRTGESAQEAFEASAFTQVALAAGANYAWRPRAGGKSFVLRLEAAAGQPWALESIVARLVELGPQRLP